MSKFGITSWGTTNWGASTIFIPISYEITGQYDVSYTNNTLFCERCGRAIKSTWYVLGDVILCSLCWFELNKGK